MKKKYSVSDNFIIRYPFFSFTYNNGWELDDIYNCNEFHSPLYIASPVLLDEFKKLKGGKIKDVKSIDKINISLYKYWSRIKSRPTPFGLFSGVSLGEINDHNDLIFSENSISKIRMDMKYLFDAFTHLKEIPEIKRKTLFYPNDSIYSFDGKYRFVEKKYFKDSIKYEISATDKTSSLKKILSVAKNGVNFKEIIDLLVSEGYDEDEDLYEYIHNIIDSQVLISELEPALIGEDYLEKIIKTFEKRNIDHDIFIKLQNLKNKLDHLNKRNTVIEIEDLLQINEIVKNIDIPFDSKYLIQIDSTKQLQSSYINKEYTDELINAISFLSKIGLIKNENEDLESFKSTYQEKYESEEISLLQALDPEIGIGYPVSKNVGKEYSNSLIKNFRLVNNSIKKGQKKWDQVQDILLEKIIESKENKNDEVVISEKDFPFFDMITTNMPSVIYSIFEVINDQQKNASIYVKFVGNGSGAKLMSRFSRLDKNIEEFVKKLIKIEQSKSNFELVELSHLSESPRVGNISIRPKLTEYEITCLSRSNLDQKFVIPLSDIMVSIKRNKIILKSKKLKKEIFPILTTAHNFRDSPFPVYRFLCDIQYQNLLFNGLMLNLNFNLNYIPRIRYKNTILRLASWEAAKNELTNIFENELDDISKMENISTWIGNRKIPQYVLISEDDNEMFIDFNNINSVNVFLSLLKKKNKLKLVEFLFNEKTAIIKDSFGNSYRNQIIIPLFKNDEE
ncbi:lantibiotic dehydratase family protein [Chryseobacterium sp. ISL-6]|uniref:lantibiotic dehydratase family protein n=1 Tax=Chryseobacterium sp. ISL-6 TaxID=2819143 RepID=UPI001BEBC746|nr:lantibiotic dehydratase family protein [Chryseobacterium sp. ISL-6]MBT2620619.1 lantibiotic dehydratase family protein [Chryseobacterium sp. ISL-6]